MCLNSGILTDPTMTPVWRWTKAECNNGPTWGLRLWLQWHSLSLIPNHFSMNIFQVPSVLDNNVKWLSLLNMMWKEQNLERQWDAKHAKHSMERLSFKRPNINFVGLLTSLPFVVMFHSNQEMMPRMWSVTERNRLHLSCANAQHEMWEWNTYIPRDPQIQWQ